jgi:hypothetical protein
MTVVHLDREALARVMPTRILVRVFFVLSCAIVSCSAPAQIRENQARELRAEIASTGSLRVIVTLRADEQEPPSDAAIRSKQKQLLAALDGTAHQVVYLFPSTPMAALVVGPDALNVLLSSPLIVNIMTDAPRGPATAVP